jgi:3-oxoacyl-[acyl-carrier protein] reductase
MIRLDHRAVLITGGSRGIGRAAAILMARAGADVIFDYHSNHDAAEHVKSEIEKLGRRAIAIPGNIAEDSHCKELVDTAVKLFGKIDVLVNNAGIWTYAPIDEMKEEIYRETVEVNLSGFIYTTRYTVQQMKKQGYGKIINISSTSGQYGEPFYSHYAATKGAIISLTKSWAVELAPAIQVNCVAPGMVDTDMTAESLSNPEELKQVVSQIPMGRVATAEEIAGPILFLASDLAAFITGEVLNVNGGSVLVG